MPFDQEKLDLLNYFIKERESIRIKKEAAEPWPWTQDPILQKNKFCNIFRECDKTSRWIAKNWREPHATDPDLWFAFVIARRVLNWPASMEALGYPVPWNKDHFLKVTKDLQQSGGKTFDTAYQLLVQGQKGDNVENMIKHILDRLWNDRQNIRPRSNYTLRSFYTRLYSYKYMGSFYTGQVIADLKYAQMKDAEDWETFAVPGPGSMRGLNIV